MSAERAAPLPEVDEHGTGNSPKAKSGMVMERAIFRGDHRVPQIGRCLVCENGRKLVAAPSEDLVVAVQQNGCSACSCVEEFRRIRKS